MSAIELGAGIAREVRRIREQGGQVESVDALIADLYDLAVGSLDAAWAEVEAALPGGAVLRLERSGTGNYVALASDLTGHWYPHGSAIGDRGPAAALRALAAKLREVPR
jgi:hypothetical protein